VGKRGKSCLIFLEGIDACLCGKGKGEGAEAGEEICGASRLPIDSRTNPTRTASEALDAWRKAPGGKFTAAPENSTVGAANWATSSPLIVQREIPSLAA
jgi:hypothetical protein